MVKNLTVAILQLSESGELTYLRNKWWSSSCMGDRSNNVSQALQPHELRGPFLILGLGLVAGLLLALLELLSRARNQAKDSKVGGSTTRWWHELAAKWFVTQTCSAFSSQKSCCSVLTSELNRRFGSGGDDSEQDSSDKSKA